MLHSNCKQVKDAIREHIDNRVYIEDNDNATLSEKIKYMDTCFKEFYKYEKFHTPNYQDAFAQFLMGLPTCFDFEYAYYLQREVIKTWLQETIAEADKYSDDKVCCMYYALIYREYKSLLRNISK